MIKATNEIFAQLISVATGRIEHIRRGRCPDSVLGHDIRDTACPACCVLITSDRLAHTTPVTIPTTAKEVIKLIGDNYESMQNCANGKMLPAEDVRYQLTVHDMLSAFSDRLAEQQEKKQW